MAFTHLHTHTEYSLLDGSNKISEYVARVKELGMDSAAITDHGNMYGVIEFYKAAGEAGINPIIGCEVYVAPNSRLDRETSHGDDRYYHLVLLAENNTGYANLMKLVSIGFTEGYYYRPRIDKEVLKQYHEGLIALSACLAGEIPRALLRGSYEEAKKTALWFEDCFGKGNFFLELQNHGIAEQQKVNQQLVRMSEELGIELVCTNDIHYTNAKDAEAHDVLLCIQTGKKVTDADRMRYEGGQYYVKSEEEMKALFPYALQAVENTHKIAERCHVEIEFNNYKIPKYEVPEGYESAWEFLNQLCEKGFEKKYRNSGNYNEEQLAKLYEDMQYELGIIQKMGFVEYILVVWDYINWSKTHDCWVGPGRGSAAGSKVCYCTGITNVDPVKYDLLFERFLNPERVSMPDIDVDFEYAERYRAIEYVTEKYGAEAVTQIVTFGTMAARGVIKAVGKALDFPYSDMDKLAKMIPMELGMTIDKAIEVNPELHSLYESDEGIHGLIEMAKRLEGLPNHTSVHAAGVVIYPGTASDYVPLARANDGTPISEYNMVQLEELGLLKMDFLGLRTLTVLKDAVKNIKATTGIDVDLEKDVDLNDKKVLDFIGTGRTEGVFQLESAGMQNFMKELRPQSFEDVVAGISLFRPGPMDFIPDYIKGKNNRDAITYATPMLQDILESTYGCIVYQEQVMQIFRKLAGYTMGQADNIRRAMSKKKQYVIDAERESFVSGDKERGICGCVQNGIAPETARAIYDSMENFAKYAFNKSHAAAYAVISMQTAWLKCYYPDEFMAALLTSFIDSTGKLAKYLYHCKELGIQVLPPDINCGLGVFTAEGGAIRYGLYAIKSIGRAVIDRIIGEREAHGPYRTLSDFAERVAGRDISKRAIENLIKAGACDSLDGTRKQMVFTAPAILDQVAAKKKSDLDGQVSLFDLVSEEEKQNYTIKYPDVGEYEKEEVYGYEKEVLGIYLTGHPLEEYEDKWRKNITATAREFVREEDFAENEVAGEDEENVAAADDKDGIRDNEKVIVGGMISSKTVKYTKNNKIMAFLSLEDLTGNVEIIVFPQTYEKYNKMLEQDGKIFVVGHASVEEDKDSKVICDKIIPFDETKKELWFQFENKESYFNREKELLSMLKDSDGNDEVVIYVAETKSVKYFGRNRTIGINDGLLARLRGVFGENNVKVVEKGIEKLA